MFINARIGGCESLSIRVAEPSATASENEQGERPARYVGCTLKPVFDMAIC